MATSLGFPFTCAQWKELERQAMVYKYMMASVPVPPDLLLPIQTDTYTAAPNFHTQCKQIFFVGRVYIQDPYLGEMKD